MSVGFVSDCTSTCSLDLELRIEHSYLSLHILVEALLFLGAAITPVENMERISLGRKIESRAGGRVVVADHGGGRDSPSPRLLMKGKGIDDADADDGVNNISNSDIENLSPSERRKRAASLEKGAAPSCVKGLDGSMAKGSDSVEQEPSTTTVPVEVLDIVFEVSFVFEVTLSLFHHNPAAELELELDLHSRQARTTVRIFFH